MKSIPILSNAPPVQKRFVVTPNRSYFQKTLASELQVCTGIQFLSLLQAVEFFSQIDFPRSLELLIALSKKVKENEEKIPVKLEKESLISLCDLFFKYGRYGGRMLQAFNDPEDWQEYLFNELFFQDQWPFPYRELKKINCPGYLKGAQIHVFGFSFLPKLYLEFFFQLSAKVEIYVYFQSPCKYFWEDLCSDRERVSLQRYWKKKGVCDQERKELDHYLQSNHPLLANLGKLGRKNLEHVGLRDFWIEEEYKIPEGSTCLKIIQRDLIDFSDVKPKLVLDSSIEIHACGSSQLREVEILFQNLLALIHEKKWDPSDILVLAPQIEAYAPFIRFVFSNGILPYRIRGLSVLKNSSFAQGMVTLFSLIESRWEKEVVLDLFENPLFEEKHHLTKGDVSLFRKWLETADVQWGWDFANRKKYLEEAWSCDDYGSFSDGIRKMIEALTDPQASFPIQWSETETLHKILRLLNSLKEDIFYIESKPDRTVTEWGQLFSLFGELYFGFSKEEGFSAFQSFLTNLDKASKKFTEEPVPFSWIFDELKHTWNAKSFHVHTHLVSAVSFASISETNLSPHKMIYLMGMDEESFPHVELISPFDKLSKHPDADYCPSQAERDRYLFLQTFLHAKECLWVNYRHLCAKDGQQQNPSTVLQDFFSYVERSFGKTLNTKIHPSLSFHKSYFQSASISIPIFFQAACGHYRKRRSYSLLSFIEAPCDVQTSEQIISIDSIRLLLKDPFSFFCREVLQLQLYRDENKDPFQFTALDRYLFRKDVLRAPFEEVWDQWMRQRPLPSPFREREEERLRKEAGPISDLGIGEIFTLKCTESMGDHCYPPLIVNGKKIVGSIPDICERGMISNTDGSLAKKFGMWGDLLLFSLMQHPIPHQVFFLKEKKPEQAFHILNPEHAFERILGYYLFAKKHLSPLKETWIRRVFENNEKELKRAINKDFQDQSVVNPYWKWIFSHSRQPDTKELLRTWHAFTQKLLQPVNEAFL